MAPATGGTQRPARNRPGRTPVARTARAPVCLRPDLDLVAGAFKIPHLHCHNRAELYDCIKQLLATDGPIILGIDSLLDQAVLPGVPSTRLPDGRMVSRPLHEMAPLLSDEEMRENMTF